MIRQIIFMIFLLMIGIASGFAIGRYTNIIQFNALQQQLNILELKNNQ